MPLLLNQIQSQHVGICLYQTRKNFEAFIASIIGFAFLLQRLLIVQRHLLLSMKAWLGLLTQTCCSEISCKAMHLQDVIYDDDDDDVAG